MREAVMLCRDFLRMGGTVNEHWSLRRLREAHDAEARLWAFRHADPTPWADEWCHEVDGYRFTLLRSAVDFKAEGMAQRNCIASYAERARRGEETAFRIEGAARASVSFGTGGRCELKLACNRHALDAVHRAATLAWTAYRAEKKELERWHPASHLREQGGAVMARYCAGFVFGISLDIHYPNLVDVALLICIAVLIVAVVRRAMGAA
jgi:hypothetical protein